jgi:hypothetical protein
MTEQDKKIKELLKGSFDDAFPSLDFTKNIMGNIARQEVLKEQQEFEYEPVISRLGWTVIGVLFLGVASLGITSDKESMFKAADYIPHFQFDSSIIQSQLALFAVLSVFTLLVIENVLTRFRLS